MRSNSSELHEVIERNSELNDSNESSEFINRQAQEISQILPSHDRVFCERFALSVRWRMNELYKAMCT